MSEKNMTRRSREEYLLAVRTKELQAANDRILAMEEIIKLQCSLLAVALLAACGEEEIKKEGDAIYFLKDAVKNALLELSCMTSDVGDAYRIMVCRNEQNKEAAEK